MEPTLQQHCEDRIDAGEAMFVIAAEKVAGAVKLKFRPATHWGRVIEAIVTGNNVEIQPPR